MELQTIVCVWLGVTHTHTCSRQHCVYQLTVAILVVAPMTAGGGQLVAGLTDCKHGQHTTSHLVRQPYGGEGRKEEGRGVEGRREGGG